MSQKETTDVIGRHEVSEPLNGNLSRIAELARRAYQQKRTKDCLDLTRAMLLIEPDNADAQQMRSSIQSEMHQDLESARAFLRQAQNKESAETSPPVSPVIPADFLSADSPGLEPLPISDTISSGAVIGSPRFPRRTRWLVAASVGLGVGIAVVGLARHRSSMSPEALLLTLRASDKPKVAVNENITQPEPLPSKPAAEVEKTPLVAAPVPAVAIPPVNAARIPVPVPSPAAALPDRPVVAAIGVLAVSSAISVDIYENDAYLGSVPVSLELPAGAHTLEYRHGSLRKSLTHVIKGNETLKTMVTFDVSLPINSKPWAEVFVDGVERKDLGQTPLSGVRVPIGGVLVFENPQFQPKKYRVTGNETGIQVVFP